MVINSKIVSAVAGSEVIKEATSYLNIPKSTHTTTITPRLNINAILEYCLATNVISYPIKFPVKFTAA